MLRRAVARLDAAIDQSIRRALQASSGSWPSAPAVAVAPATGTTPSSQGRALGDYTMADMWEDMRTLWGVPKYRTSKPKKQTRKFAYTRLYTATDDVVTCEKCGEKHELKTICGTCYEKVREITNEIKKRMMAYNPYKGELPPKQVDVRFTDDDLAAIEQAKEEAASGVKDGVRIVELERPRPSWFRRDVVPKEIR